MKREDLKVGGAMTFDDAQRFLLDKLDAADADNMIRFIRGQEARIQLQNNGWISVDVRLPEKACFCLIFVGGDVTEAIYSADSKAFHYASGVDDSPRPATHWQPLPPAPEQLK